MIESLKQKFKEALHRAEDSEKKLQELQKKNEDYKRAY